MNRKSNETRYRTRVGVIHQNHTVPFDWVFDSRRQDYKCGLGIRVQAKHKYLEKLRSENGRMLMKSRLRKYVW